MPSSATMKKKRQICLRTPVTPTKWIQNNGRVAVAHAMLASNPAPSHERAWYTLFTHALDFLHEESMIGQWVGMRFYDKLAQAKNSVYQALIWTRPGYEANAYPLLKFALHKTKLDEHARKES